MKKARFKIAALAGGSVLTVLLLFLLIFNWYINGRMEDRAREAIYDIFYWIDSDEENYSGSALYYPEILYVNADYSFIEQEDLYTDKEIGIVNWCRDNSPGDIAQIKFEGNTIFVGQQFEELYDGYILAYVDVTGEPELITLVNIIFLIAALIIVVLSGLGGFFLGRKMEQNELSQKQFFENTSHELKTPLTSIRGYAEGIQTGVVTDYRKAGNAIAAQTEKMSSLVEDILCISRIESGALKLKKEHVKMNEFVEDCLMPFEGVIASKHLAVDLDLNPARKNADPDRLEHALSNLIGNAIKYAKSRISISCNETELTIWNDCEPLTREDLHHMFDRFYTGKKGSTGIGLALAKEITELHGWTISAENKDDGLQITIKY